MDIWWVTPEKRSRSSIASFFMFSFDNRANPRLVLLLVPLVRGNGFTALLGQKQWCFNLQKSNVCLVLAFVCYIFFANSTNTECNYICTCIFVIIWHMIWQCHINWAFLRASQTASAMCCYLPWRRGWHDARLLSHRRLLLTTASHLGDIWLGLGLAKKQPLSGLGGKSWKYTCTRN